MAELRWYENFWSNNIIPHIIIIWSQLIFELFWPREIQLKIARTQTHLTNLSAKSTAQSNLRLIAYQTSLVAVEWYDMATR